MVGIKLTRNATGRVSAWSTEDLEDPVNQIHLLHDLLDRVSHARAGPTVMPIATLIAVGAAAIEGLTVEVRDIPRAELVGTFFRARPGSRDALFDDFGPPPSQPRNRFNADGQQALYLSRSAKVLGAELSQEGPIDGYWVQEFAVGERAGAIVQLAPGTLDEFTRLNQLMILAERPRSSEPLDPYVATNLLRDICDDEGLDAIEYPTITGLFASDPDAVNVAILSPTAIEVVIAAAVATPHYVPMVSAAGA